MNRPRDIREAIQAAVRKDIKSFSESDQRSGYADYMSRYYNEIPDHMTDNEARDYLGIPRITPII